MATTPPPFFFGASGPDAPSMSFAFAPSSPLGEDQPPSPTSTIADNFDLSPIPSSASSSTGVDDDDDAMDMDIEGVHGQLSKLELSDTDMEDSDSDSNFSASTSSSEAVSDDDDDDDISDAPPPPEEDDLPPNPYLPPHFTSPLYDAWLASQIPNILFQIRIKPVIPGSMIAAHSIRLWYRDFVSRGAFLGKIVEEYQLIGVGDICGFIVKERRSGTWVEFGKDEESWGTVMGRIRNRFADENLTGSAIAVRAELKVLVGGEDEWQGKVVEKGVFGGLGEDDPDL
ncbi:hypothetical protein K440DRAFT_87715 [Wilcoxina mikolae CBS 423.85]|nr:hypothetical protein K440DRAFT_87715 [Wilcoxina mikolae CBS 423.85]